MKYLSAVKLSCAFLLLLITTANAQSEYSPQILPTDPGSAQLVYSVDAVEIQTITIDNDGRVLVIARGQVPTGGWHSPRLEPWYYIVPPADGIYDFDFMAIPPDPGQIVIQGFQPITVVYPLFDLPEGFAGVRVHARTNSMEGTLE